MFIGTSICYQWFTKAINPQPFVQLLIMNILAVKNHDSDNMKTGILERKPSLIGLFIIDKKLSECQAQSHFAGCKPALHL